MKSNRYPTAEQKRHHDELRELGSILTQSKPVEIAHCHGGSMIDTFGYKINPGWSQRQNHWLVIPLTPEQHNNEKDSLDRGVRNWEKRHHTQVILLEWVSHLTGINVFEKAGLDYEFRTESAWTYSS